MVTKTERVILYGIKWIIEREKVCEKCHLTNNKDLNSSLFAKEKK